MEDTPKTLSRVLSFIQRLIAALVLHLAILAAGLALILVFTTGRLIDQKGREIVETLKELGPLRLELTRPEGDVLRGVSFGEFTLRLDEEHGSAKLAQAQGLSLRFDPLSLAGGELRVGEIALDRPFVTLLRGRRQELAELYDGSVSPAKSGGRLRLRVSDGSLRLVETLRGEDDGRSIGLDHINLDATLNGGEIAIHRLDFSFLKRTWIVRGAIHPKSPEKNSLNVDLARIEPRELMNGLKHFFANSPRLRPEGAFRLYLKVSGDLSDPRIEGDLKGEFLQFSSFRLDDPRAALEYSGGVLKLNDFQASLLGGRLEGAFELRPQTHDSPFNFTGRLSGAELTELFEIVPGVDAPVRGAFDAEDLILAGRADASERLSVSAVLNSRRGDFKSPSGGGWQRYTGLTAQLESLPDSISLWEMSLKSRTLDLTAEGRYSYPRSWELEGLGALDEAVARRLTGFPSHAPEALDRGKVHFRWEWNFSPERPAGPTFTPQPARDIADELRR